MNKRGKEAAGKRRLVVMEHLLAICRGQFGVIEAEYPKAEQSCYRLRDLLMMGLSIFVFKYPSLLQYLNPLHPEDNPVLQLLPPRFRRRSQPWSRPRPQEYARANIRALFRVESLPTDTTFRRRVDEISTHHLDPVFRALYHWVARQRWWSEFKVLQNAVLVLVDGTGVLSSSSIHCAHCRVTKHQNGEFTYSHHMVAAAIVHPTHSTILPFDVEPVGRADGASKNDCELEAAKRLLRRLRERHPKLPMVIVADALYSTGPMVQLLRQLNMHFILGVKRRQRHEPGIFAYLARRGLPEAQWQPLPAQENTPK